MTRQTFRLLATGDILVIGITYAAGRTEYRIGTKHQERHRDGSIFVLELMERRVQANGLVAGPWTYYTTVSEREHSALLEQAMEHPE